MNRFEFRVNYVGTVRHCSEYGIGNSPEEALEGLKNSLIEYKRDMDNSPTNCYSNDEKKLYNEIDELVEDIDSVLEKL